MPPLVLVPLVTVLVIGVAYAVIASGADPEILGWLAAALTLLTFSMRSMLALRLAALGANIGFITYAASMELMPVLALHLLLVPCNTVRLGELIAEKRRSDPYGGPPGVLRRVARLWRRKRRRAELAGRPLPGVLPR